MRRIKSFRYIFLFIGFCILTIFLTCSEEGTNPYDEKFVLPDSNVSFYEHVEPLFNARCGMQSGCHSSFDGDKNGLTYNELIDRNGLIYYQLSITGEQLVDLDVDPKNPQTSVLYLILSEGYPDVFYDQMPPPTSKEPLNTNQLNGVKQWIREGAPE